MLFDIQPANGEANIPSLVVEKHDITSIRTKEEEKPREVWNVFMFACLHVCSTDYSFIICYCFVMLVLLTMVFFVVVFIRSHVPPIS